MAPPIGFVVLTHQAPLQILRLTNKLNAMFDFPPIVFHHDFSKCALPEHEFTKNVSFVRPHLVTSWAHWSVVEGTVRALDQMYKNPNAPSWFVLLSGSDYPIKPAARVLKELNIGNYDAHIHHMKIQAGELTSRWRKLAFERYFAKHIAYPSLSKTLRPRRRTLTLRHPLLTRPMLPFNDNFNCYGGSQWFSGNARVARHIIDFHKNDSPVKRHYSSGLEFSEESYFQTILANASGLKLHDENWRFTSWKGKGPFPRTLGQADLPELLSSPKHFARKFDLNIDAQILDHLDAVTAQL